MRYFDHGATSWPKPKEVCDAVRRAMEDCANPGRGSHAPADRAAERVYGCREAAGELFACPPERVVLTASCTHGLNIAIATLVRPGSRVVISGFEHNAVTRPLHGLGARVRVAGRRLFHREDTLAEFCRALDRGADAAVFTCVSNVFGYRLPFEQMADACRRRKIPFVLDAAQAAGAMALDFGALGADFMAMPGHKGLLGPMGTGLLLCRRLPRPLLHGGTGSDSVRQTMPRSLPDVAEAGTANVPGIAGLEAGLRLVARLGPDAIGAGECRMARRAAALLRERGMEVFAGPDQSGTVSFRCGLDCEEAGQLLARAGIAVRAGLHCAPLAHRSAGTLDTGTVRLSFGYDSADGDLPALESALDALISTDNGRGDKYFYDLDRNF